MGRPKLKNIAPTFPLEIEEKRMLQLIDYAVKNDLVLDEADFYNKIRFAPTSITKVRRGEQAFTRQQIKLACLLTGANANWVFDIEKDMFRAKGKNKDSEQLFREAMAVYKLEKEDAKKKQSKRPELLN